MLDLPRVHRNANNEIVVTRDSSFVKAWNHLAVVSCPKCKHSITTFAISRNESLSIVCDHCGCICKQVILSEKTQQSMIDGKVLQGKIWKEQYEKNM